MEFPETEKPMEDLTCCRVSFKRLTIQERLIKLEIASAISLGFISSMK